MEIKGGLSSKAFRISSTHAYISAFILTEFEGDEEEFNSKLGHLRQNKLAFDDSKDEAIELLLDENIINHLLVATSPSSKLFSLREGLGDLASYLDQYLTTESIKMIFPHITKEYKEDKLVDIKQSFNPNFMSEEMKKDIKPN